MAIERLALTDTVDASTYFAVNRGGQDYRATPADVASYIQTLITAADDKLTQYSAPSASGFSVQINDDNDSVWLILTPVAGYAAGTLVLPAVANCVDKQEIIVNCTQAVTTLTITGNGSTVTGEPTTLAANDFFRLRFDGVTDTWYRIG